MSRYSRPVIGDPFWDSFWSERGFFDTHFGDTLTEEDFFPPPSSQYLIRRRTIGGQSVPRSPLMAPMVGHPLAAGQRQQQQQQLNQSGTSTNITGTGELMQQMNTNDKYQIMVDVSHFNPDEISVKMIENAIVVTGKHEEKADNYGYVSRQFQRKYMLPGDIEPETVSSTLSADGILTIQAPRKKLQISDSPDAGRSVPIAISNKPLSPALNLVGPQFPAAPDQTGMPYVQPSAPGAGSAASLSSTTTTKTSSGGVVPIVGGGGSSATSGTITVERTTTTTTTTSGGEGDITSIPGKTVPIQPPTASAAASVLSDPNFIAESDIPKN